MTTALAFKVQASPAETLSNDELLAEVTATLNKKP
jgi:hypothetical protein